MASQDFETSGSSPTALMASPEIAMGGVGAPVTALGVTIGAGGALPMAGIPGMGGPMAGAAQQQQQQQHQPYGGVPGLGMLGISKKAGGRYADSRPYMSYPPRYVARAPVEIDFVDLATPVRCDIPVGGHIHAMYVPMSHRCHTRPCNTWLVGLGTPCIIYLLHP